MGKFKNLNVMVLQILLNNSSLPRRVKVGLGASIIHHYIIKSTIKREEL